MRRDALGNEILKRAAAHFARENVLAKLRNTQTRGGEVPNRFRIGVVGGSVAGCAVAVELSRAGHEVTVSLSPEDTHSWLPPSIQVRISRCRNLP